MENSIIKLKDLIACYDNGQKPMIKYPTAAGDIIVGVDPVTKMPDESGLTWLVRHIDENGKPFVECISDNPKEMGVRKTFEDDYLKVCSVNFNK